MTSCKQDLKIINAYINLKNELIIKVNSIDKDKLINNWPTKAFKNGIQYVQRTKKYFIALNRVDKSFDTNNEDFINYLKQRYNIEKVIRIIKKSTNEETTTLRLETHDEDSYKSILNNGIKLGFTFFRAKEWKFQDNVKQCFKCQKLGHVKAQCKESQTICLRCSETHDHHFSKCQNEIKCANCGENHPSCSKLCQMLKNYVNKENLNTKNKIPKNNSHNIIDQKTSDDPKTNQLNDLKLYGGIYSLSITLIRFILDTLKYLNEATASVNENPIYIKNLILKHFGSNITTALENEINRYVVEQSNLYESDIDSNMSADDE